MTKEITMKMLMDIVKEIVLLPAAAISESPFFETCKFSDLPEPVRRFANFSRGVTEEPKADTTDAMLILGTISGLKTLLNDTCKNEFGFEYVPIRYSRQTTFKLGRSLRNIQALRRFFKDKEPVVDYYGEYDGPHFVFNRKPVARDNFDIGAYSGNVLQDYCPRSRGSMYALTPMNDREKVSDVLKTQFGCPKLHTHTMAFYSFVTVRGVPFCTPCPWLHIEQGSTEYTRCLMSPNQILYYSGNETPGFTKEPAEQGCIPHWVARCCRDIIHPRCLEQFHKLLANCKSEQQIHLSELPWPIIPFALHFDAIGNLLYGAALKHDTIYFAMLASALRNFNIDLTNRDRNRTMLTTHQLRLLVDLIETDAENVNTDK